VIPTTEHHADQWYVSCRVQPLRTVDPSRFYLVLPSLPMTRGGLISPVGDGTFALSLSGRGTDPIPRAWEGLLEFAATLGDPAIGEFIRHAVPATEPSTFHRHKAVWR